MQTTWTESSRMIRLNLELRRLNLTLTEVKIKLPDKCTQKNITRSPKSRKTWKTFLEGKKSHRWPFDGHKHRDL